MIEHALATLFSFTLFFTGICDKTDQVYKWSVTGNAVNNPFFRPWLDKPIYIRGVELTKISGGRTIWFMAGNNMVPDTMAFIGSGENHTRHIFPDGTGQPMPAKNKATPADYIDLHGACEGGGSVQVFYTVYYTEVGMPE